ncbi:hypothetical protein Halhy_5752 [Haliscomenobacter hydrossis DSM 1100]|uniref:Uncharacterized protein n=1 Tax=Haliscomenobacter hydrossis (strain ATCC 27775 / DSM 1100 / LMG 10767 / O) TaxID=760192 RepID=F4KWX5_HALH1|nr:hypothetical protein Halhy_5752 [Haliscomenobacter hydrossis DSM 1100]
MMQHDSIRDQHNQLQVYVPLLEIKPEIDLRQFQPHLFRRILSHDLRDAKTITYIANKDIAC